MNDGQGQATVEVALALPVVMLLLLTLVQVALVMGAEITTINATRQAARAYAVDPRRAVAEDALDRAGIESAERVLIIHGPSAPGPDVTLVVRRSVATAVPIVGRLLPDVQMTAKLTVRVE